MGLWNHRGELLLGNKEGLLFKSSRGLDLHNQVVSAIMIPETSVSDKAHFVLLARIESGCGTPRNWQAHLTSEGCFGLFDFVGFLVQRFFQLHCLVFQTFYLDFKAMLHFGIFP